MPTHTPTVDASGCTSLRTEQWRENMVDDIEASAEFGPEAQTGPTALLGQVLDIHADRCGELSELGQSLYDSFDPDAAEGVAQDNCGAMVGVQRQPATYSTAPISVTGTPAVVIDTTKRVRVPGSAYYWAPIADITIGGGGTATGTVKCTTAGPILAPSGEMDEIVDTVAGWDTVTNTADATPGTDIETDAEYRVRREESLSAGGTSTGHALRVALEALADITSASVLINDTMTDPDADGVPAKAFMPVIWPDTGIDEEAVAETIWAHTPTGIPSHGTESGTITDSQGKSQTVKWSYATEVDIYWDITVTKTPNYPADGDDLIKAAVLAYGATLSVGDDVLPVGSEGCAKYITDSSDNPYYVPGVKHLVIKVDKTASPTSTTPVDIAATETSAHAAARITVTSS